ncbi:MAG: transposase, partial [Candidatus Limnocylindrus sp.]
MKLVINEHFPVVRPRRPRADLDSILDGMEYMLWTGIPYRALENTNIGWSCKTVNAYIVRWARTGIFKEAYERL